MDKLIDCTFCNGDLNILYEDNYLYIVPDFAPLVNGHCLIIPKRHIKGTIRSNKKEFIAIKNAIHKLHEIYNENYTIFEHGAFEDSNAGASISHAHLHIIPMEIDFHKQVENELGLQAKMITYDDLHTVEYANKPYLFMSIGLLNKGYYFQVKKLPRQYLRKMILEKLDSSYDYNWEKTHNYQESINAVNEMIIKWNHFVNKS